MPDIRVKVIADANTKGIDDTTAALGGLNKEAEQSAPFVQRLNNAFAPLAGITAGAGIALHGLEGFMGSSVDSANRLNNSLVGLNSVATAFHQDAGAAKKAAQDLAKDGLMTVADSALALKNLLASGFSLPESINLINRFKDTAAFGRQAGLEFGYAITSATEGIKNGNSILVDNAGVTKNLSIILQQAGKTQQDVMNVQSDASVRQALYTGLLKETIPQLGDAARLSDSYAGAQARSAAQTTILKQQIGQSLQAALLPFLQAITPIIAGLANWIEHHQKLAAAIGIGAALFLGFIVVIGAIGTAIAAIVPIIAVFGAMTVGVAVAVGGALAFAAGFAIANWDRVKGFFSGVPGWIGSVMGALPGILFGIFNSMTGGLLGIVWGLVNGIVSIFGGLPGRIVSAVGNIGSSIANQFKSALHGLHIPGFATGVQNFSGGLAVVGEQGPELVNLPRGSSVIPNGQSQQMMANSSSSTYNIQSVNLTTADATRAFFEIQDRNGVLASKGLSIARGY